VRGSEGTGLRSRILGISIVAILTVSLTSPPAAASSKSKEGSYQEQADAGTVDGPYSWHDGPDPWAVIYNGDIIAGTANYIHFLLASGARRGEVDYAYVTWISGVCVKQQIYARIWDNTAGFEAWFPTNR